ncbi:RyR domain-containing protein [Neobacillus cucumis]|uniref:Ryanodine receptor Ryr n=1 Tax=Neobacillus cucumis TaxID=1740721 RepID=A0A2N5H9Y1_9BACI|nr:RyR domain-containing protein [Neobacillus cucumis]PLS02328.1 Ryanodine receptor Ryr [Neobacillus cucumis]
MYKPRPIDTAKADLPKEILELKEELAEHIHEIWASQRMEQGWRYGPNRDDTAKTHPNLIPYAQLAEIDKDYDRSTAMETLKVILSLGYTIEKKNTRSDE